ncbi:MAG: PA14 domain-containing protein, partial [candidate division KSB1 bacterium]|nr:PA14 domain-containing protein [candidate division KSB1 bacterium]
MFKTITVLFCFSLPLFGAVTHGLLGSYYDDLNLTEFVETRIDSVINFDDTTLGAAPAGTKVKPDGQYSIRWTGFVRIDSTGSWQFFTMSNDGVRLWLGEDKLIDNWTTHTAKEDRASRSLQKGWYPIRLEYFQDGGGSIMQLRFQGPGFKKAIIPSANLSAFDPRAGIPTVDAGQDRFVELPTDTLTLTGTATDTNGVIVVYRWEQTAGPSPARLEGTDSPTLHLSGLVEGKYVFRLTVIDNDGDQASDEVVVMVVPQAGEPLVSGELKKWHKVTLTFDGPPSAETATPNPFLDYRLTVTFTAPDGRIIQVPGFYAADGRAAETSADFGRKWQAVVIPDQVGLWRYKASFRFGSNIAVDLNEESGEPTAFDGVEGSFTVAPSDKQAPDFRAKGLLQYVGGHHLRFAETGEYFLKGGADSPENFLAYYEFDGTWDNGGKPLPGLINGLHRYEPHLGDWRPGDPTWQDGKGKGIIGALN